MTTEPALVLSVETAFGAYGMQLSRMDEYLGAISPCVEEHPQAFPLFVESLTVTWVAFHEHFLASLVAGGAHHREPALRTYLTEQGKMVGKPVAPDCDLRTIIGLAKGRLSFKRDGAKIVALFRVLFGMAPWPSEEVRRTIFDLVRLRNIFVHEGDAVFREHAEQFYRAGLFKTKTYDDLPTIHHVDHRQALVLLRDAAVAMKVQADHFRQALSRQPQWLERKLNS